MAGVCFALCGILPAADQQTQPNTTADGIAQAVRDLESQDPKTREGAIALLKDAGPVALPFLEQAATSRSRTVSETAFDILEFIKYGITPETPADVYKVICEYRDGDAAAKLKAVCQLAAAGEHGRRALRAFAYSETSGTVHKQVFGPAAGYARKQMPELALKGDLAQVESLLRLGAVAEEANCMQDFAVFLLLAGDIKAEIQHLRRWVEMQPNPARAKLLCHLYRTAGDLNGAEWAARASGDRNLLLAVHREQANWKELIKDETALLNEQTKMEPTEAILRYGRIATYNRLAGNQDEFRKAMETIREIAKASPKDCADAEEVFLLNGLAQDAIDVAMASQNYTDAVSLLLARGDTKEAESLFEKAVVSGRTPKDSDRATWAKLNVATMLLQRGRKEDAEKELAAFEKEPPKEAYDSARLTELKRLLGKEDQALQEYASMLDTELQHSNQGTPAAYVLFGRQAADALAWWDVLRMDKPEERPAETVKTLRALMNLQLPDQQFAELAGRAVAKAQELPSEKQLKWFTAIAASCADYDQPEAALACLQWCHQLSNESEPWCRTGEILLQLKRYDEAAGAFHKAWELEKESAGAVYLEGWALAQAGKKDEGEKKMFVGRLLPLGDTDKRWSLVWELEQCRLIEQVSPELETILRAGEHLNVDEANICIEIGTRKPGAKHDYAKELNLIQRLFFLFLYSPDRFTIGTSEFQLLYPDFESTYRALELLDAGKLEEALKAMEEWFSRYAGDTSPCSVIVPRLDELGHKKEADQVFNRCMEARKQMMRVFSGGAIHHICIAGVEADCKRDLDDALAHARKAVELDPSNSYSWAALVWAHQQRGELKEAIRCQRKVLRMEPSYWHWWNLDVLLRALEAKEKH